MNIKNILVTGSTGKVGRRLVPALLAAGYRVRAMQHARAVEFPGAEVVAGDIANEAFVRSAMQDMQAVCHLASSKEDCGFLEVSTRGTFNLLEAARQSKSLRQFILAGGDCSLGIFYYANPKPLDESAELRAYPGYYAFSKVLEEVMCRQYAIQYGLPVTILRCSWIHADDDLLSHMTLREPDFGSPWKSLARTPGQKEFFEKRLDGVGCLVHPGGKAFLRHIVSIHDVVDAFGRALQSDRAIGQTFNIACPEAFTYDVLAGYIGRKLDLPAVQFELDGCHDFSIDVTKARAVLGCPLSHDVFAMADEAIAFRHASQMPRG